MEPFEKPQYPTGYIVFDHETKCFRGKYLHISDIRTFCIAHNISPIEIIVLRTFGPKDSDFNRKLVSIEEYAHKHIFLEKVGDFLLEKETWEWHPQPEPKLEEFHSIKYYLELLKLKFKIICIKLRETFPYSI